MDTQDIKFLQEHPDAEFVAFIKVGGHGVKMYYTDREKYERKLDRVWDSGLDLEKGVLKGKQP